MFGGEGLQRVHYLGFFEISNYQGRFTGKVYRFGMERMYGYVDVRDVDGLLAVVEDGQKVFEIWR